MLLHTHTHTKQVSMESVLVASFYPSCLSCTVSKLRYIVQLANLSQMPGSSIIHDSHSSQAREVEKRRPVLNGWAKRRTVQKRIKQSISHEQEKKEEEY